MKILFLTTHNLATNPRLVKEIDLAIENSIQVTLICFEFDNWSESINENLKKKIADKITYIGIQISGKDRMAWYKASFINFLSSLILKIFPASIGALSFYLSKKSWMLHRQLRSISSSFDLVVAHNPGAFYPSFVFAKKNNIRYAIDVEDYHPGETKINKEQAELIKLIQETLPNATYISAASPLILEKTLQLISNNITNEIILNVFKKEDFISPDMTVNGKLKLIWFSQYIDADRGLENLVHVINKMGSDIELHLIGNLMPDFYANFLKGNRNVFIHKPLPQKELHRMMSEFDVGLAFEDTQSSLNRDLCLTNKIFTYLQSGLFILASKTTAQQKFINEYKNIGIAVSHNETEIESALIRLISTKEQIRNSKKNRYINAHEISWESESKKLLKLWGISAKSDNNFQNEKVLFITNERFLDYSRDEGGVRLCTEDYIKLLSSKYQVDVYKLTYNKSISFKIQARLGIDVFEDYNSFDYKKSLSDRIKKGSYKKVFINLSSASRIAEVLKAEFKDSVKIIFCSHGIESGDFLHSSVRFKSKLSFIKNVFSAWRLGRIIQKELEFRLNCFDLILTVSEIEKSIELWLGAKIVCVVPRVFHPDFITWNPIMGRLGFIADVSHMPNYFGLLKFCDEIERSMIKVELRIVGKLCKNLKEITDRYPFAKATGYLNNKQLADEASTWMYYLNLVFYYSKGVSTKLAKGMNMGIPVLSTSFGNRGYVFKSGSVLTVDTPFEMAAIIKNRMADQTLLYRDQHDVRAAVESFSDFSVVMNDLFPIIEKL